MATLTRSEEISERILLERAAAPNTDYFKIVGIDPDVYFNQRGAFSSIAAQLNITLASLKSMEDAKKDQQILGDKTTGEYIELIDKAITVLGDRDKGLRYKEEISWLGTLHSRQCDNISDKESLYICRG